MTLGNAVSRCGGKLDAGVHGPRLGAIFFGGVFVPLWPSCHPSAPCPVSVRGGPGPSCRPPCRCLSRPALACSEGGGGCRALEQCLSCYQTSALESWKGSTGEAVPEKTNFRSRLMWEKACVHGGSFGDLGRGLGRPGPRPWRIRQGTFLGLKGELTLQL